jgi:AcrR family transcriptional regulator
MRYDEFKERTGLSMDRLYQEIYQANRAKISVKKDQTVQRNLVRILQATLKLSNQMGFQAMSMRDFSRETGLSMGALYSYFSGKDELLDMIMRQGRRLVLATLETHLQTVTDPAAKLEAAVRLHLFISEALQPWFCFSFMEAKNMNRTEKEKTIASELYTDQLLCQILRQGQSQAVFKARDAEQSAAAIKALLQDWYVKRWKFAQRGVTVDAYADFVVAFVMAFHGAPVPQTPAEELTPHACN